MADRRSPTDLTDAEFAVLAPLFAPYATGRPRVRPIRDVLDAIFSVLRAGCAWRLVPREFPPWPTVYHPFRRRRDDGTWDEASQELRRAERVRPGRDPEPGAALVDSQSVKTTEGGAARRRRRQEDQRAQAAQRGRHPRAAAAPGRPPGRRAGPRRRPPGAG